METNEQRNMVTIMLVISSKVRKNVPSNTAFRRNYTLKIRYYMLSADMTVLITSLLCGNRELHRKSHLASVT
jgi:hypothetical protein